jgi:hypothetical protein
MELWQAFEANINCLLTMASFFLLRAMKLKDLVEFIQLINRLINKFKIEMTDILQEIFPAIVGQVFALLP